MQIGFERAHRVAVLAPAGNARAVPDPAESAQKINYINILRNSRGWNLEWNVVVEFLACRTGTGRRTLGGLGAGRCIRVTASGRAARAAAPAPAPTGAAAPAEH